jgi:ABC-type dipeptide/oligopeptide/nickel transport system permease subunit
MRLGMRALFDQWPIRIAFPLMFMIAALAVTGPLVTRASPFELHLKDKLKGPSASHVLGTDEFGRDLLSRLLYGGRVSLGAAGIAVAVAMVLGSGSGLIAGYVGGWIDTLLMRAWDILLAFPVILVGLVIVTILGPSELSAILAVTTINVPIFSRLARAGTLVEIRKPHVEAARSVGATEARIMVLHVFPNVMPPLITQTANAVATAVLLEAAFSFLGLGVQPPNPSWGGMLQQARLYLSANPWYGVFPGLFITIFVLSLNTVADGLQNVLDPTRHLAGTR